MGRWRSTVKAWAQLARVSNLPTCLSNVLVGLAIGASVQQDLAAVTAATVVFVAVVVSLLYVAGMVLNDVVDLAVDRRQRPARPIPSGHVSRRAAAACVLLLFIAAIATSATGGTPALLVSTALVAAIIGYNLTHQRWVASCLLMGACRGLVYLYACSVTTWPPTWPAAGVLAGSITLYTVALTLVARAEVPSSGTAPACRWLAPCIGLLVLPAAVWVRPSHPVAALLAACLLGGWLLRPVMLLGRSPPATIKAVLTYLAGMCLVDTYFLTLLDRAAWAPIALILFALTCWAHRRIPGT